MKKSIISLRVLVAVMSLSVISNVFAESHSKIKANPQTSFQYINGRVRPITSGEVDTLFPLPFPTLAQVLQEDGSD